MSNLRSLLSGSPGVVIFNGQVFFMRDEFDFSPSAEWRDVLTSYYGRVDDVMTDFVVKIPMPLWASYQSLLTLIPAALRPQDSGSVGLIGGDGLIGASLFPTSAGAPVDLPVVIWGANGDKFTFASGQVTKLFGLHLGPEDELYSATPEITCLRSVASATLGATYAVTNAALTEAAFKKTFFNCQRWGGVWGSVAGFTSLYSQTGWDVSYDLELEPIKISGYGTVDYRIQKFTGQMECIPYGPTVAQYEAAAYDNTAAAALPGTLASSSLAADLTLTGVDTTSIIGLKAAYLPKRMYSFGAKKLRIGKTTWKGTQGFTTGVPNTLAEVTGAAGSLT